MGLKSMFRSLRRTFAIAGIATVGVTGVATADDTPSYDDLARQLKDLQSQVAEMRQEKDAAWTSQRRNEEMRALVEEALADAETRTAAQATAGFGHNGKNFVLESEDGAYSLRMRGQIQARYISNNRNASGSDDHEFGMQIRRTRLLFNGHIGDPKLLYQVYLDFNRNTSAAGRNQTWIAYKFNDMFTLGGGHFKGPLLREELVGSPNQLAVERSLVNEMFTDDHLEGVFLKGNLSDDTRYIVTIHDGQGSGLPARDFHNDATDFGFTGRVDHKLGGDWKAWKDFTSWEGEPMAIFLGAAIQSSWAETGEGQANDANPLSWSVDAAYENNGANAFVAFIGDQPQNSAQEAVYALVAQGGYNIANTIEPFVRWEHMFGDEANVGFANKRLDWDIITMGVNYYLKKHLAKFTVDVMWALNELEAGSSGVGLLTDTPHSRDQLSVRAQFQLMF